MRVSAATYRTISRCAACAPHRPPQLQTDPQPTQRTHENAHGDDTHTHMRVRRMNTHWLSHAHAHGMRTHKRTHVQMHMHMHMHTGTHRHTHHALRLTHTSTGTSSWHRAASPTPRFACTTATTPQPSKSVLLFSLGSLDTSPSSVTLT
jgi:hypothetical protein